MNVLKIKNSKAKTKMKKKKNVKKPNTNKNWYGKEMSVFAKENELKERLQKEADLPKTKRDWIRTIKN